MNKRIATLTLVVSLLAAADSFAAIEGAWTGRTLTRKTDHVNLNLVHGRSGNIGTTFPVSELTGVSAAQLHAAASTAVKFELRREAGVATFDGTFRGGKGAGHYTFVANRGYFDAVRALGVEIASRDRHNRGEESEEERLFVYALHDVSTSFIRSMQAEGIRERLTKYLEMRIFDITPAYIREMRSLGLGELDAKELIDARVHGVTPDYVRRTRAAGWNLSFRKMKEAAIHGATPEYAERLAQSGYGNLDFDDLIAFRIHGVTPEYIAELRELGYRDVSPDKLVEMRIHGVTPRYIRALQNAGYNNVPVDKMIRLRMSGIDPATLKKMND